MLFRSTYTEIGQYFGATRQCVAERIHTLAALVHSAQDQTEYEQAKPYLMTSLEEQLLASLADSDKLAKASLNNVAYALTQLHQMKRLEEGKSSANIGIVGKLVVSSDSTLFDK